MNDDHHQPHRARNSKLAAGAQITLPDAKISDNGVCRLNSCRIAGINQHKSKTFLLRCLPAMVSFHHLAFLLPLAFLLVRASDTPAGGLPAKRDQRHLRPVYESRSSPQTRRDSITPPDVGQIGDFKGSDPEPVRGPLGDSFLQGSNTAIDEQNIDNVAPPTTDAGKWL
jgi:hypothetical protein